jgi:undecaprenyl-diphosphatase
VPFFKNKTGRSFMIVWQAVILGIVQGLTEMFPVSSSAHLTLLPWFLNWSSPLLNSLSFDVALHFGSLLALIVYFRDDLWDLTKCWGQGPETFERRENRRLGILLAVATVPGALAGFFFEKQADEIFRDPTRVAWALLVAGALMVAADLVRSQFRDIFRFRPLQALLAGCFQAFAVMPGVSRSGSTLTALRALGFRRPDAARISFLMAMPLLAGATILKARHLLHGLPQDEVVPLVAGIAASAVTSYLVVKYFMRFLRSHTLLGFGIYRFVLAAVVLVVAAARG